MLVKDQRLKIRGQVEVGRSDGAFQGGDGIHPAAASWFGRISAVSSPVISASWLTCFNPRDAAWYFILRPQSLTAKQLPFSPPHRCRTGFTPAIGLRQILLVASHLLERPAPILIFFPLLTLCAITPPPPPPRRVLSPHSLPPLAPSHKLTHDSRVNNANSTRKTSDLNLGRSGGSYTSAKPNKYLAYPILLNLPEIFGVSLW